MSRMLVINPDGTTRVVENADYNAIVEAVGGWIEGVPTDGETVVMYCNDEGKMRGLPENPTADWLWASVLPRSGRIVGDRLVGPVAVFGLLDADGETTDVPAEILDRFELNERTL